LAGSEDEREVLTWAGYGVAVRELVRQVADSGFRPDLILAIARGGLFPAGSLGYALSVKNLYVMNLEFYSGVDERLDVPVMLPPYLDKFDLTDASILVVDDVADTGHTLKAVFDFCQEVVAESRTAVLYEKPQSLVKCDFVWKKTSLWINFPWSTDPPLMDGQGSRTVLDA
jgi:hypoxanthine phosphoribosyltransferase